MKYPLIAGLAAVLASLAITGCAGSMNTDRSELAAARAAIADARAANAEKCAPKELASAQANLLWAAHELDEVGMHPDETAGLIADAEKDGKEAKAVALRNCGRKPAPKPRPVKQEVISLSGVQFETNSAALTPASVSILDQAVATLNKRKDIRVEVAAHTDSRGNDAYNMHLSETRAASVRDYLVAHGIDASRLTSRGYGETDPIASNATAAGRAKNRRVELRIIP